MPRLDALRRRITATESQLETLRLHFNGESPEGREDDLAALRKAGLITADDSVHPLVLDLVRVVTGPMLELVVESAGPQGATTATIWIRDEDVWFTDPWPGDDTGETTYCRDELTMILWTVARLTGFRRAQVPGVAREFSAPLAVVTSVLTLMAYDDLGWDDVRTVVLARSEEHLAAVDEEHRPMLLAVLSGLQGSFRVTCMWGAADEQFTHARGIAVWDAGPGGYWLRTTPPEPLAAVDITPDAIATWRPISGGDLWKEFAGLLPSKAELEAVQRLAAGEPR